MYDKIRLTLSENKRKKKSPKLNVRTIVRSAKASCFNEILSIYFQFMLKLKKNFQFMLKLKKKKKGPCFNEVLLIFPHAAYFTVANILP